MVDPTPGGEHAGMAHWRSAFIHGLVLVCLVAACGGAGPAGAPSTATAAQVTVSPSASPATSLPTSTTPVSASPSSGPVGGAAALVGSHRCLSRALYLDAGGGSGAGTCPLVPSLVLAADGRWTWETQSGSWSVRSVTDGDWQKWGIPPFAGVTQVLVLDGWGDGPIERESGYVWVISHQDAQAGTLWLKWGPAP